MLLKRKKSLIMLSSPLIIMGLFFANIKLQCMNQESADLDDCTIPIDEADIILNLLDQNENIRQRKTDSYAQNNDIIVQNDKNNKISKISLNNFLQVSGVLYKDTYCTSKKTVDNVKTEIKRYGLMPYDPIILTMLKKCPHTHAAILKFINNITRETATFNNPFKKKTTKGFFDTQASICAWTLPESSSTSIKKQCITLFIILLLGITIGNRIPVIYFK